MLIFFVNAIVLCRHSALRGFSVMLRQLNGMTAVLAVPEFIRSLKKGKRIKGLEDLL